MYSVVLSDRESGNFVMYVYILDAYSKSMFHAIQRCHLVHWSNDYLLISSGYRANATAEHYL